MSGSASALGEVQDVHPAAGLRGRLDDLGDGAVLRRLAAGRSRNPAYAWPVRPAATRRSRRASSACTIISPSNAARSRAARPRARRRRRGGNSSTPECSRKHLKPNTPASCSGRRSARLPGTAPPQKPTSTKAWSGGRPRCLASQRLDRRGRRDAVERHVDDRRDATGRRGAGGAGEALPLGAARLVDVHVGVDQAGQQDDVVAEARRSPRPRGRHRRHRRAPRRRSARR